VTAAKVQAISRPVPAGASVRGLPVSALRAAPWNARKVFDVQSQDELIASIHQHGVLVALIVRPIGSTGVFEVVAGHRRFFAGMKLNLEEMPCDVRELSDEQAREVGLVDNLQRTDLSALEEAEAFQQMLELAGASGRKLTPADVAAKLGRTEAHVRLRLRLLSADAGVRDALREGAISFGHALELARLEPAVQKQLLRWLLLLPYYSGGKPVRRDEVPSLNELRRHIAQEIMLDLAKAPFDTKSAELVPAAGACVECPKRTGNNKLLFADVKQGDLCTDPPCFAAKVTRGIDVTIKKLTAKGTKVVRISEGYQRSAQTPKEALTSQQYSALESYVRNAKTECPDFAIGIYVDGHRRGSQKKVCLAKKCKVHGRQMAGVARPQQTPKEAQKKANLDGEKAARLRIFTAMAAKALQLKKVSDAMLLAVAVHAIEYSGEGRELAKALGWPENIFSKRADLEARIKTLPVAAAIGVAMLSASADDLYVGEYRKEKPEQLEAFAKQFGVDVARVRKEVAAEAAAKVAKKQPAKKVAVLSAAARSRIAAAQKRRLAKVKKGGKK
jgi:ParB family transcriptional regulator, chromosome partitioning protein